MSLVSKAFSDIVTFSRSSNATRVGPTGRVEYAPHNLVLQSQTFDNASWNKLDATVTSNAIAAPDGTVTADKLIATTAVSTSHAVYQGAGSISANWTFSIYAKAGEYNRVGLAFSNTGYVFFNLTTGVQEGTVGLYITSYSITSVGNGWYRISFGSTVTASGTNIAVYLFNSTYTSGDPTFTGDGTSGIYLWGAQLSVGPYPLDYTPTTTAAVYGPRFDYDPVTLAARGLLVEEQRTNYVLRSEEFETAWTLRAAGATLATNVVNSPGGTATADQLTESTGSATSHGIFQTVSPALGSASHTFSVYVKNAVGTRFVRVAISASAATDGAVVDVNPRTGAITQTLSNGVTNVSSSVSDVGNGWYRVSITATMPVEYVAVILITGASVPLGTDFGYQAYTADNASGVYIWGAQLEAGSFATSYIPTIASTVTRSADVASVNTLSPWYNATEGSFLGEFEVRGLLGGLLVANDGTDNYASSIIFGEFASSNSYGLRVFVSTTAQADFSTSDPAVNSVQKFAGGFKANDFGFTKNGAAASTDTSGSIPTAATNMRIGRSWTGANANMWIRRIAFYPRKLSSAELQTLTA